MLILYLGSVSVVLLALFLCCYLLMICGVDIITVGLHGRLGMAPSFVRESQLDEEKSLLSFSLDTSLEGQCYPL